MAQINAGQDVQDLAGNALSNTTPGSNQTYTVTNAPEISVSSSVSGAVADRNADAQGSRAAGSPVTVTYTVTNSGTDALSLSTATSSAASNVVVGSISAPGSSSVAAGGGSTTFTVQYTPTVAGAFSFDLAMVNGDADESPYNITVSGTATGAPEISVSSSESGALTDGGTDTVGTATAQGVTSQITYTISNGGTDVLTLTTPTVATAVTASSNVSVSALTLASTALAPGGSTTLVVDFAPTAGGAYGFTLSLANNDPDEASFDILVSGSAAAAPTVVLSGAPSTLSGSGNFDITATFSEPVTGFVAADVNVSNGTVAGLSGSGASYTITITPTGGDVSISIPAGIASSASTGALNEASASTTVTDQTAAETEREIATFLNTRANLLIGNQPDLRSIVFGGASGGFTLSSKSEQLNFALNPRSGAPLWFQLQGARSIAGDRKADYLFGAFGGHTWVNDRVAVGAMLQVDKIEQRNGPLSIEGRGWLVGPYVAARAAEQPLFFEAYVLYGQSENDISPFGTYTDQFDTERWLLHTAVTGEVQRGKVTYFPSLSATYTTDAQKAYTDSLGNPIAAQRLEYGQIALGLDFETPLGDGRTGWSLQGGLQGSYAFKLDSGGSVPSNTDYEGGSGRLELGVSHLSAAGGRLELSGFYDGIGAEAYEVYG
ncbi:MAG: Ig-like domain-containing protein, partial [Pseudomonadota bacterium]|nr:Ig-like domain-containing protein [Pseudomonadota bacterium]